MRRCIYLPIHPFEKGATQGQFFMCSLRVLFRSSCNTKAKESGLSRYFNVCWRVNCWIYNFLKGDGKCKHPCPGFELESS